MVTLIFIISLAVPVVSSLNAWIPSSSTFKNADRFFKAKVIITLINVCFLRVAFATLLNFNFTNPDVVPSAFNMFASIALTGILIGMPAFYIVHIFLFRKELRNLKIYFCYRLIRRK